MVAVDALLLQNLGDLDVESPMINRSIQKLDMRIFDVVYSHSFGQVFYLPARRTLSIECNKTSVSRNETVQYQYVVLAGGVFLPVVPVWVSSSFLLAVRSRHSTHHIRSIVRRPSPPTVTMRFVFICDAYAERVWCGGGGVCVCVCVCVGVGVVLQTEL